MQFRTLLSNILIGFIFFSGVTAVSALDETPLYQGVLQLRSYRYDSTTGLYSLAGYGSSVSIGGGKIVTNAHVIMNSDTQEPYGTYEVCQSRMFDREPKCFSSARLVSYDEENDLALLTVEQSADLPALPLSMVSRYRIGDPLIIYGYPSIGGSTITRTAGRIAGYSEPFYKVDGIIDRGNSGGGAFGLSGEILGIPSRLLTDNNSLGYMIPASLIRSFLMKKTPGLVRYTTPVPESFMSYIREKQSSLAHTYNFRAGSISGKNMKKYGIKFMKNLVPNPFPGLSAVQFFHEKRQISFYLVCGVVSSPDMISTYWKQGIGTDYEVVATTNPRYVLVRHYVQKDLYEYMLFDREAPCILYFDQSLNPRKDAAFLGEVEKFLSGSITSTARFERSEKFHGSLFDILSLPSGALLSEYPNSEDQNTIMLTFRNSLGETKDGRLFSYHYDRTKDLLGNFSPWDKIDSGLSVDDIGSLIEKNKNSNETLFVGKTRSGQPYYLITTRETEQKGKTVGGVTLFIVDSRAHEGYELLSLNFFSNESWLDNADIEKMRQIFDSISLHRAQ